MSTRKLPSIDIPGWKPPQQPEHVHLIVALKTITPLFGGSGKAGEVDSKHPIRAASVKGHLRFWWRATTGASFTDLEALQKEEDTLFGKAVNTEEEGYDSNIDVVGNALRVRVVVTRPGTTQQCADYGRPRENGRYPAIPKFEPSWPPYALQPFQGQLKSGGREVERQPSVALLNVHFQVILDFPQNYQSQIEQALAAWVFFGGVGARTRRGCGSIALDRSVLPNLSPLNEETLRIADNDLLTKIPAKYYIGAETTNELLAWETAVSLYKDFRQKPGFARNEGRDDPRRPGMSRWPEAHSIRRMTARPSHSSHDHYPPSRNQDRAFPRADLGLPIIFEFKDDDEPDRTTLEGRTPQPGEPRRTRFASPVITKALQLPNGKFVPMIAILDSPRVWALGNLSLSGTPITQSQVKDTACPPMATVGKTDIREGLLEYAYRRGFTVKTL